MHILLDECVHAGVKAAFEGHLVETVATAGWKGSKDGPLLRWAQNHFDVFVTADKNLAHQHNLKMFKLGIVVVRIPNNEITSYQPLFGELREAVETVVRGAVIYVTSRP